MRVDRQGEADKWAYNPHLLPMLRFDATGQSDEISSLIEAAGKRQLTSEETKLQQDAFAKLSGTVFLPFGAGEYSRIAVKVIGPRGNEVLRVHRFGGYDTKSP